MNEFKSEQTKGIEATIEAEAARQVRITTARMKLDRLLLERKSVLDEKRRAAIEALLAVEAHPNIPPKLKAEWAIVGGEILAGRATTKTRAKLKALGRIAEQL
ncbi:MAG: hypothetical protein KGJ82_11215 [Nitrospirota bacterium]|nr:hypothetical protein [Nitrospirota bacterium]